MAGNLTDYLENELLDHTLKVGAAFGQPAYCKLALFKSDPTDTGDVTNEVSGGAYVRQNAVFTAASGGSTSNDADVTFPQATADWGTITHIGIMDLTAGGNMLWHGALTTPKTVNSGDTLKIPTGDLDISLD